ncbi:hypothetical protein CO115_00785 [Candidatus Falkowbacteria bacterium CG_4_9_14_3_um_filter_36_9]|nr:MAG: hypothetical protein CO115_00785 [Candidatus Falkowbacteria bacterium CG_4_9_14_3_um_filter_36_9]
MSVICIFGDSITYGACDIDGGGWANRLRRYIENKSYYEDMVYILGVDGDTSESLLERFNRECFARKLNIIIFAIGINDSLFYNKDIKINLTPLDTYKKNINKLLSKAKEYTEKIIFIGLTKVEDLKTNPFLDSSTGKCYQNSLIIRYNEALEKICLEKNLLFIKIYDLLDNSDLEDGLHPNAKGHEKMFKKIKDDLIKNKIIL